MEAKTSEWRPGPTVCRCCLTEGCYKDISTEYFWMGKREVYAEMLSDTLNVTIAYSQSGGPNSNSRLICEPCISRLRDASEFKRQVQECEKTFMQHLDPGTSSVIEIEAPVDIIGKEVKLERVKLESALSDDDDDFEERNDFATVDDDDDDDDLDDQPLTKLASKVPKKESVDLLDLFDNTKAAEKRKATIKLKMSPAKKAKPTKKEAPKPTASKTAKPEKKKKDGAKQNALIILRNSTAYPFIQSRNSYRCCFCNSLFEDPNEFRLHMDTDHMFIDIDEFVEQRYNSEDIIRVDITDLKCDRCGLDLNTLEALAKHLNDKYNLNIDLNTDLGLVPFKLEKDRFACVVCSAKFSGPYQLSRHTNTHFLRHICYICGKGYGFRSRLEWHIKNHSMSKYFCRRCRENFPSLEKKKEHHRTSQKCFNYKCFICNERFRFWELREEHLVQVHNKPRKVFKCTECQKVLDNRRALYLHFKAKHTDDYKCQICSLKFATRIAFQAHIFKHTGERPKKCSICEKSFATEKALRQHMIIHDHSKKLVCSACGKLFTQRHHLKAHVKNRHPDVCIK